MFQARNSTFKEINDSVSFTVIKFLNIYYIYILSQLVISLSSLRCLTPDAEARPDIVEVSAMISEVMMKYLDNLSTSQLALEKKLDRERRRTQRYFMEANRNAVTCHHDLALLSHVGPALSISLQYTLIGCPEVIPACFKEN